MQLKKRLIRYSTQSISVEDIKAVSKALNSDFLTEGPLIEKFEKKLAKHVGATKATAVCNASAALIIACNALKLIKNDYFWTTPISFAATANCALFFKARVDFVDINNDTFNIDVEKLENKLIYAKKNNKLPKILCVVHLGGNPCDLLKIKNLSRKYKFHIIEDASHALGAKYKKIKIGNSKYSDIVVFSFHPVKMITTGEGGALLTNNILLDRKIKSLRSHGIIRDKKYLNNKELPKWYYEQKYLSSNYRMTSFQAALGLSQLERISYFTKRRNQLAKIYEKRLSDLDIKIQYIDKNSKSSRHLFIILVQKKIRNKLYEYLAKNKIQTNLHYIPIYNHPYYKKFNYNKKNFINAEKYYSQAISIPLHCDLSRKEQNLVIKKINFFMKRAS
jgi:UDP-4-amino-4,6-dideoxy-N-acetyl-beta-L-altrosamine transaminase